DPAQDSRRIGQNGAVVRDEHGHELLAADLQHGRAIRRVDVDPFDLDALVAERERDALDVGRERDPEDAHGPTLPVPRSSEVFPGTADKTIGLSIRGKSSVDPISPGTETATQGLRWPDLDPGANVALGNLYETGVEGVRA